MGRTETPPGACQEKNMEPRSVKEPRPPGRAAVRNARPGRLVHRICRGHLMQLELRLRMALGLQDFVNRERRAALQDCHRRLLALQQAFRNVATSRIAGAPGQPGRAAAGIAEKEARR